jgi:serine/threonine protein kinase
VPEHLEKIDMAVTLTGYTKAISLQTPVREGLGELRNASKEKAQEHLTQLRSDLQSKTGVVRLLHTTSTNANQEMEFKNAGGFKSAFLSGKKLKQSGEVIRDLLKSAGLSETKVKEFNAYVQARGGKGVKAQKVLQYIDAMRSETGHSPDDALSKFGVDLGTAGRTLGAGAFGIVRTVRYRGEEFVYKEPSDEAIQNGYDVLEQLKLIDASGQPIDSKNAKVATDNDDEKSYEAYSGSSLIKGPSPLQNLKNQDIDFWNKGSVGNRVESNASSDSLQSSRSSEGILKNYLLQNVLKIDDYNPEPSQRPQAKSTPAATGPKLGRTGIANAIRVKDLPQVLPPTAVVVRETASNGDVQYHAVAGQKTLKDWARTQPTSSHLDVVGLLMPKAVGNQPIEYPKPAGEDEDRPPPKVHVSRSDLKPMAASALKLIQGIASHGFIHGDIKPENLVWDSKSKTLQLIDNDGLLKVSKKAGTQVKKGLGTFTLPYTNPVAWHSRYKTGANAQLGLGRDLFSMGAVLLETSLRAKGQGDKSDALMGQITFSGQPTDAAMYLMSIKKYETGIAQLEAEPFAIGSVEDFARTCIIESIRHEEARLDNNNNTFERYDKSRPDSDQHLLSKLERKFAQLA